MLFPAPPGSETAGSPSCWTETFDQITERSAVRTMLLTELTVEPSSGELGRRCGGMPPAPPPPTAQAYVGAFGARKSATHGPKSAATLVLPAASTCFTWNVCEPLPIGALVYGLEQPTYGSLSIAQRKVEPASPENVKVGVAVVLGFDGPE